MLYILQIIITCLYTYVIVCTDTVVAASADMVIGNMRCTASLHEPLNLAVAKTSSKCVNLQIIVEQLRLYYIYGT